MHNAHQEAQANAGAAVAFATRQLIREYDAEIAARRAQLVADRALYRAKLAELDAVDGGKGDPLGRLYRAHLHAIEALLGAFSKPEPG